MKHTAITFLACCLFTGCASQKLANSTSLEQKDRIFESYLVKNLMRLTD